MKRTQIKLRGNGSIYPRTDSPYLWCKYFLRGKPFSESTGQTDEKEAMKYLQRRLIEVGADRAGLKDFVTPKNQKATVNDLLDSLEADLRTRGKWKGNANHVGRAREGFGNLSAVGFDSDCVSQYIAEQREAGSADATLNRRMAMLNSAFHLAVKRKRIASAPYIPKLSEIGNERKGFFETAQFADLLRYLPDYLEDLVRFDFKCGWRSGAVKGLEWSDVNEDEITLPGILSKNREPVTIPIDDELREIIDRRRAASVYEAKDGTMKMSPFVFHRKGKKIGDHCKAWYSACCAAGLGKMVCRECGGEEFEQVDHSKRKRGPIGRHLECAGCHTTYESRDRLKYVGKIMHDFRRTAARNMVKGGTPESVAMQITGHKTTSMFRRYAIVDQEQKREALAKAKAYASEAKKKVVSFGRR